MSLDQAELDVLRAIRRLAHPLVLRVARALSYFGEHSLGWIVIGMLGIAFDPAHRSGWVVMLLGATVAHAASSTVKRIIRRQRPTADDLPALCSTPSRLSFPSSHAASSTAAAVGLIPFLGLPLAALIVLAMAFSRLLLGVHYPTDVLAGILIGLSTGLLLTMLF